jgi:TRAP-type C4-dicarboxylate transport system substrate-binding protein
MLARRPFSALALLVPLAVAAPADAADLALKMSVESAPGAATQVMLAAFRDALQEELGDAVAIEYFDGGTLGDEIVHMELVRTGQLDVIPIGSDAVLWPLRSRKRQASFDKTSLFAAQSSEISHLK